MNFDSCREFFIGTKDKVHLDSAAVGITPITARTAILQFIDMVTYCDINDIAQIHISADQSRKNALKQISQLINTDEKNLALINNTSHGLNIACNVIPWQKTDEVIIANTEYLQVAIPFLKKQETRQLTVVPLFANEQGRFSLLDIQDKVTKYTKAICISSVQWCTGQRVFTKELGDFCKANNIWLIIDGVQEAGALDVNLKEKYCDFYVAGGHKWLNSPYGSGFLYMSDKAQNLRPHEFGYLNLNPPTNGWNEFFEDSTQNLFTHYSFPAATKSFANGGTSNAVGAIALLEAIKIVNTLGPSNVENRILELSAYMRQKLESLNARIFPLSISERSGITIFRLTDSPQQESTILQKLKQQRIFLSMRYGSGHGGLRASTHYFNNEKDIDLLCSAIKSL